MDIVRAALSVAVGDGHGGFLRASGSGHAADARSDAEHRADRGVGGAAAAKPGTTVTTIDAVEQYFNPPTLTVPLGTSVQWHDLQGTPDVVAYDRPFASTVMFEGGTYSFTFTRPGSYPSVCTLREGAGMVGEIIVEAEAKP